MLKLYTFNIFPINIFYNSNSIYKILIKSLYKDYMNEINNYEKKYKNYMEFMLDNNEDYKNHLIKTEKIKTDLINCLNNEIGKKNILNENNEYHNIYHLFYDSKTIYKIFIKSLYNEYIAEYYIFHNKYPNNMINTIQWDKFDEKIKEAYRNYWIKRDKLMNNICNTLISYSICYPNETISKNRFVKEYEEYPYRLKQCLYEVLLIFDNGSTIF